MNVNNGVETFTSINQSNLHNPVTKQRFHFQLVSHTTFVGGAMVVEIDRFGFSDCLGPKANGA